MSETTLLEVFIYGMITALATGLGAIPLIFKDRVEGFLASGQVIAAGLMTFASIQLIHEGIAYDTSLVFIGIVAGIGLIVVANQVIKLFPDVTQIIESKDAGGAREGFLIIFVMTIHSAAEGVGVGVSFGGGHELGVLIALTIALHNIPEGLAISLITVPRGMGVMKSALWSIGTSLPQPIIGVLAFIFVQIFATFLPFGLGLAAGAMFWMVGSELLPEARKNLSVPKIAGIFLLSALLFAALVSLF